MGQHVPQRRRGLAVRGELGPEVRDRAVVLEEAPRHEQVREGGRHVLAGGEAEDRRACGERPPCGRVGHAGHRVDVQRAVTC